MLLDLKLLVNSKVSFPVRLKFVEFIIVSLKFLVGLKVGFNDNDKSF